MRVDAIRHVLETENGFSNENAFSCAERAFDVWTQARHNAILNHLAPGVVETLENIRTSISHNNIPVLLGAITDGNSDPRRIEVLSPYFDFCVNAESVGISKPDKRVYLEAIRRAMKTPQGKALFSDLLQSGHHDVDNINDETLERIIGPVIGPMWTHIGDDFLKDCVAAKDMKMRTIYAVGLVRDKILANGNEEKTNTADNVNMDITEFIKQVSSQSVVTLGIGASDYLAKSLHGEFVDAVAQDFFDISEIIRNWHEEAVSSDIVEQPDTEKDLDTGPSISANGNEQGILEIIEPAAVDTGMGARSVTRADGVQFKRMYKGREYSIGVLESDLPAGSSKGIDFITAAKEECRKSKIPVFKNPRDGPEDTREFTLFYKLRDMSFTSENFKEKDISFILNGPNATVEIEVVPQEKVEMDEDDELD